MQNLYRRSWQIIFGIAVACVLGASAFGHPGSGILVDRLGQVYFIDTGSGLWKIDAKGAASRLSPLRNHWLAMDPNDRFIQSRVPTDPGRDWVITAAGSNPTILISSDFPIVIGQDGNLYYPAVRDGSLHILRINPEGRSSTFATLPRSVAGPALGWINGLATSPNGSIHYTEDNAVRRIAVDGKVWTIATVTALAIGTAIPGVEQRPYLRGLTVDSKGIVYVADSADARVLKITADGKITTLLQLVSPWAPTDVAVFGDIVYVLEFSHTAGDDRTEWMPRIRKITPDGKSDIILTVDQMPGARAARPVASVSSNNTWTEFFDMLWQSILRFAPGPV